MKYHFILNPYAGKGNQINFFINEIKRVCEKSNLDYKIHLTVAPLEATSYVKEQLEGSDEIQRFYSFGGDGTLNEVINGAIHYKNAEVGLIPIGTGNDFCKNFTEKENFFNIENQIEGTSEKIDLLKYNDRYCINMLNVGFDCNVAYNTQDMKQKRFIPNKFAYIAALVKTLFQKMYSHPTITIDGVTVIDREILMSTIANGSFCGGGFNATPYASILDSTLDISVVEKIKRLQFISLVGSYKKGTHMKKKLGRKYVSYVHASSLHIDFDKETKICVDGEIETMTSLDVSIAPRALSFIVPKGSEIISKEDFPELKQRIVNLTK